MKEKEKDKPVNPIIQRTITNPSVAIQRCAMQVVSTKHERVSRRNDKHGNKIWENLHHVTFLFSQDTISALERDGILES